MARPGVRGCYRHPRRHPREPVALKQEVSPETRSTGLFENLIGPASLGRGLGQVGSPDGEPDRWCQTMVAPRRSSDAATRRPAEESGSTVEAANQPASRKLAHGVLTHGSLADQCPSFSPLWFSNITTIKALITAAPNQPRLRSHFSSGSYRHHGSLPASHKASSHRCGGC